MKIPNENKVLSSAEIYDYIATLNFPSIHAGGSQATIKLLEMFDFDENMKILDVGCGSGTTACLIAERYSSKVTGIDISVNMIKKAQSRAQKRKLKENVYFEIGDVYNLPYNDSSFDAVIFESVLTPLSEEKTAFSEMFRVTRSGGLIGGNEAIFYSTTPPEIYELVAKHPSFSGTILTNEYLKKLFEKSNLKIIEFIEQPASLNIVKELGLMGIIGFMVKSYPKLIYRLIRDSKFRDYQKLDDQVNKLVKEHTNYALVLGRKK